MTFEEQLNQTVREAIRDELAKHFEAKPADDYLTINQAAETAGVSKSTLRNWLKAGLKASKVGATVRLKRSDLDAFIGSKKTVAKSATLAERVRSAYRS